MNKVFYLLIVVLLIGMVGAETETYRVSVENNLQYTCTLNDAIPSGSATFNLSIYYPNGSSLVNNKRATAQGQGSFNYSVTFPEKGEDYKVKMFCTDGTHSYSSEGNYRVTAIGGELNSAKSISYILVFIIGLLIFAGLLIMGIYLPAGNDKDEMTGYILAISNLKYLKMICLCFAYLTGLVISYFAYTFSYAYLDFDFLTSIFRFLFYAQAFSTLPLFILFTYFTITNLIRDNKIGDSLMRGLRVK